MTRMKLIKNAIQCTKCGDIIESKSRHDFVQCSCGACFVDGGLNYQRIGGNMGDWEDMSEWEEIELDEEGLIEVDKWERYRKDKV